MRPSAVPMPTLVPAAVSAPTIKFPIGRPTSACRPIPAPPLSATFPTWRSRRIQFMWPTTMVVPAVLPARVAPRRCGLDFVRSSTSSPSRRAERLLGFLIRQFTPLRTVPFTPLVFTTSPPATTSAPTRRDCSMPPPATTSPPASAHPAARISSMRSRRLCRLFSRSRSVGRW